MHSTTDGQVKRFIYEAKDFFRNEAIPVVYRMSEKYDTQQIGLFTTPSNLMQQRTRVNLHRTERTRPATALEIL